MVAALAAVLLAVALVVPAAAEDVEVALQVERVTRAFRDGRYRDALTGTRALVDQFPRSASVRTFHGSIAEYMGEFDEALDAYATARRLAPERANVHYAMGTLLVRLGQYQEALSHLDWFVTTYPWETRWKFLHGTPAQKAEVATAHSSLQAIAQLKIDVVMETGDIAQARALAREYGIVQPGRDYCAEARTATQRSDDVFKAQRLAALATPPDPDCVWWYGQWLTDEGYVRLAQLMVREGAQLTPSAANKASGERYLRVRLMGGRTVAMRAEQLTIIGRQRYLRDGDVAGAVRLLEEAIRIEPAFPRPYLHLSRIAWDGADHEAALAWLERAIRVDPSHWRAHRNLGQTLMSLGRHAEAEAQLRTTLDLFEDDAGARLMLARTLYALGKYEEYVTQTRRALQFAQEWSRHELSEVRDFLAAHERTGPATKLPPTPDPRVLVGWNHD